VALAASTTWARIGLPSAGLLALARRQLRRSFGSKLGAAGAAGVALVALVLAMGSDGAARRADWIELATGAARWLCWLGAGPLVLAAAGPRDAADHLDGIEQLAALRGHDPGTLRRARVMAAMVATAWRVALPALALCLGFAALDGHLVAALLRHAVALGLFAVLVGVLLGGLGALCSEVGRGRGRALLLGVVLVPWALADRAGHPDWSIPGALAEALTTLGHAAAHAGVVR
jgi:hypothetical protein